MLSRTGIRVALDLIGRYQRRGRRRGHCVLTPTCSEYARLAIARFGLAQGTKMALQRVFRCRGRNAGVTDYPY